MQINTTIKRRPVLLKSNSYSILSWSSKSQDYLYILQAWRSCFSVLCCAYSSHWQGFCCASHIEYSYCRAAR